MNNVATNFKFSLTEQLGSYRKVVGRVSEIQISHNQLFGVTTINLKLHKLLDFTEIKFNSLRQKTINMVAIAKRLHFRPLFIRFTDLTC